MNYTKEKILISAVLVWIILAIPANAWISGWPNRLVINVTNPNSHINFTNYQVNVTLSTPNFNFSKTNTNGSDIRFTLVNDSTEQHLPFWIESWNASGSDGLAAIWVKVPFLNVSTTEKIYMYYGNVSAMGESNPTSTFGESSANLSIPGCVLDEPCIVSTDRAITSSGTYGHPYIRINSNVTLSISGSNTVIYFNSTGRFDVFGTLSSTGGGASNGTDGGKYYGRGSGGEGGRGNNALPGGTFGGGGSAKGGTSCSTGGGSYGGGGGNACDEGNYGYGGTGAVLSINSSVLNVKPGGSIIVKGANGVGTTGGGGGALLQLLNISTFIFNGSITVTGGDGVTKLIVGWGGGGGALFYLNNYSTTFGSGTVTVRGGSAWSSSGGVATLNIQDSSQSSNPGGLSGDTIVQQFSIEGNEPYAKIFYFDELAYSTLTHPSPVEIGNDVTIQLNYTYASNSSPITSANLNITIFDMTQSRTILSGGLAMTYVPTVGLWQYNYTTPTAANGTYKYNIKGNVSGLYGSDLDVNGTFDTKDTTPPSVSGVSTQTSCSSYSNYHLANTPFDVTFSATDNWEVNRTFSLCNFTMSNGTSMTVSVTNDTTGNNNKCSFPVSGHSSSATVRISVNDTVNNTASATLGITVVDSCPVTYTPPPDSSSGGGSGGGGGGGGGGALALTVSELPEILFETRALSLVQGQPEKLKIRLKNPKNEPLRVTLEGPAEVSFDEKSFTLLAGVEKEVYATFSYSTAGNYKPMISAQLGDLKRMYDLSVTVLKKEVDAVEQLLMDAQKAVNSLLILKDKACENDIEAVKNKAIAVETLAGNIRSALLSKSKPSGAKIEELRRELSSISGFTNKIGECKPTTIQQKPPADMAVQKPKNTGNLLPFVMAILVLLFGGFGLFKFLRGGA